MKGWVLATVLLLASPGLLACPLCMGAGRPSTAQQLAAWQHAVLATPAADRSGYRVIAVIKGERPPGGTIEASAVRMYTAAGAAKPHLLARDEAWSDWADLGAIGAEHAGWLRRVAARGRPTDTGADDWPARVAILPNPQHPRPPAVERRPTETIADAWQSRVALMLPYLEHPEPLAAQIAYVETASAPYAALRTAKPHLSPPRIRRWVADPDLAGRQPLYLLLLGVAGNAQDAAALEQRLEAASRARDATNLGPMVAADLELRGPSRMAWVDATYLRDPGRSTREIEAALLALSVHANANGAIPRARVIESYRLFMQTHKPLAGLVAQDLAAWQYWDAVPEYVALMKSNVRQHYASRVAILAYLKRSPDGVKALERILPGTSLGR
jgi:hypothetical protein